MKEKIAILTDSSSSIYMYDHGFDNLFMIDIPCFIGDEIFTNFEKNKDGVFYDALTKSDLVPKTSQPSVGESVEKYNQIKALGFTHVVYLPISKELSGTYHNAHLAKEMTEEIEIEIVDTRTSASILSGMALNAAQMAKEGKSVADILEMVEGFKTRWGYFLTVGDLTSLIKNGRLSNAKGFVANFFNIKPLIQFTREGKLQPLKKVRSYQGALKAVVDTVAEQVNPENGEIHIAYTNNTDDMEFVKGLIQEKFPNTKIKIFSLAATVTAHVGLVAIGVGYINY